MKEMHWDPERYDVQHAYVADYGLALIDFLDPMPNEAILDLGCGTGVLSHAIAEFGAKVIGIDASETMIQKAKAAYPKLTFQVADGHNFHLDKPFDAIFSNAALHWMQQPEKVIACLWQNLKEGGRFVFEMGGKNNLQQVLAAIEKAATPYTSKPLPLENYFPSIAEYATLLEAQGFRVVFMELYNRPTHLQGEEGLRNWVRMFRASVLSSIPKDQQEAFFTAVESQAKASLYQQSTWQADYVRLRGIAYK
jgi:trans-aconitate methyltransferase